MTTTRNAATVPSDTNFAAIDPYAPLPERGIWFYQFEGGEERWRECDSKSLRALLSNPSPPAFRTALALTQSYDQQGDNFYRGSIYFDFDATEGSSIADAIYSVCEFLSKLNDADADLDSLRIFATGGKGFHIEMPLSSCLDDIPQDGVRNLPYILRGLANELYAPNMDMRVYTRRRMWRIPNVKRSNGKYKVPVTAAELFEMTADSYAEICSAPRQFPALSPPAFAPTLAALYDKARQQVEAAASRTSGDTTPLQLIAAMRGKMPPSIAALCSGRLESEAGWNQIALQLGILAYHLGWNADRLISVCAGLIAQHKSDGRRYNSERARITELSIQFEYAARSGYALKIPALRALLPRGRYPDLALLGRLS